MRPSSADRPNELAAKVAAALDRLARAQRAQRQAAATLSGLTPLQVDLLTTLADGAPPEPSVGALAVEVAVAQPTATDSLRALVDKGLVERLRDPDDGRRFTMSLTGPGLELARTLRDDDDQLVAAVAAMPVAAQEALLESLLGLIAGLVDRGSISVARTCLTCRYHEHDGTTHRCSLLDVVLPTAELRVNCPEHSAA